MNAKLHVEIDYTRHSKDNEARLIVTLAGVPVFHYTEIINPNDQLAWEAAEAHALEAFAYKLAGALE